MREVRRSWTIVLVATMVAAAADAAAQNPVTPAPNARLEALKREAVTEVDAMKDFTQQMVDSVFSFGELGFQEFETTRYLVDILKKNGFTVEEGIAGIPTAWMASWGSGRPIISLGSDIDGIPQTSQKPGVAYHDPLVPGAPGHGEGHNSGQAVNITAALVVKKIMEREKLAATIRIWPGAAEELVAGKAYFIRDGYFKDVDVVLFNHVGNNLATSWGTTSSTGLVSVEYTFAGRSAHAAGAPWRGRSALDAVELMNVGWNFRREHLRVQQRSHYVITDGGDQPNVVPPTASVWYYFREMDYPHIKELWDTGDAIAEGAAKMADARLVSSRVLGAAWPHHFNKTLAETMHANIKQVGLPQWSAADQTLAKAVQQELEVPPTGLASEVPSLAGPVNQDDSRGGASDDIGDMTWNLPTVRLSFPSNIPNLPGHNWSNAIAMATPIAHKGATAGAKVQAMTILDLILTPGLVDEAWKYFRTVQTTDTKYVPFIRPQDKPATYLNEAIMAKYRPAMKKYYFDPSKYKTYLEQLGIAYPTVRRTPSSGASGVRER